MVTIAHRAPVNIGGYRTRPVGFELPDELKGNLEAYRPKLDFGRIVKACARHLPADLAKELIAALTSVAVAESSLYLVVFRHHRRWDRLSPQERARFTEDYGIVSRRVVTDDGCEFLVDAFQNGVELENMKYHGLGTGTTAAAAGDAALQTELTTEYTGNVRATGTTTENGAGTYRTVATNTLDSGTPAVTEHGILSQAATGGGVLFDRHVFAAINLVGANGDGIQSTYDWTPASGG